MVSDSSKKFPVIPKVPKGYVPDPILFQIDIENSTSGCCDSAVWERHTKEDVNILERVNRLAAPDLCSTKSKTSARQPFLKTWSAAAAQRKNETALFRHALQDLKPTCCNTTNCTHKSWKNNQRSQQRISDNKNHLWHSKKLFLSKKTFLSGTYVQMMYWHN